MRFPKLDIRLKNISWNLASGVISGGLIVLSTSVLVRTLGYDKFGIVSIWIMLQGLIQIFDFGLGATLNREISKGASASNRLLVATLKFYKFSAVAVVLVMSVCMMYLYRHNVMAAATNVLMLIALAIQFQSLCYSWILSGKREYESLSKAQVFGNILRYGSAIAIGAVSNELSFFFLCQIFASIGGLLIYRKYCKDSVYDAGAVSVRDGIGLLRGVAPQSIGMWINSGVSIFLSSADRMLIGAYGVQADVGKYSTALVAAGLLNLVTLSYYRVYYTEYSALHFNDPRRLRSVFSSSCFQLALILTALAVAANLAAKYVFPIWLGEYEADQIYTFNLLLIGMGLSGLMWLPGALCQAVGKPFVHTWMMAISLVLGVVAAIPCIQKWGYVGASAVWIVHGTIGMVFEMYLIHKFVLDIDLPAWYAKALVGPVLVLILFSIL